MEELDKLQKADGINKLLQGVKQQNVHNSQAVK